MNPILMALMQQMMMGGGFNQMMQPRMFQHPIFGGQGMPGMSMMQQPRLPFGNPGQLGPQGVGPQQPLRFGQGQPQMPQPMVGPGQLPFGNPQQPGPRPMLGQPLPYGNPSQPLPRPMPAQGQPRPINRRTY